MEAFSKWFSKCTNCFCLCDDPSNSDRYFSLREVVSNIDDKKCVNFKHFGNQILSNFVFRIVTGVRLLKYNGMIQLNIKEKELKPYAKTLYESNTYEVWEFKGSKFYMNDTDVFEGIDYHTLTQENRSINLDTVVVPVGYVVTGVRFSLIKGHIVLQVRGTEFDYISGKLINKDSHEWFSNPKSGSDELILGEVAPPFEKIMAITNKTPNLFVKFGPTDYWSDISQTTVPLIDGETIYIHENGPLAGVGLYHRSVKGYGGFIAAKLVVPDMSQYIPEN